ncbi:MAG: DUF1064 domain-containing protein [Micavibrio sp.]|nr:DUF1064 domain-containing protein [Micavibrio sp.]
MVRSKRPPRISGGAARRRAKKISQCSKCDIQFTPETDPISCPKCSSLDCYTHDSKAEARRWAELQMLEKKGLIQNLQRQVRFPLYCAFEDGEIVFKKKVAVYIADFVYFVDGERIIEDVKGGMTDVASLKLRWMKAMGQPVKLIY